jgi:hypothetical protein
MYKTIPLMWIAQTLEQALDTRSPRIGAPS